MHDYIIYCLLYSIILLLLLLFPGSIAWLIYNIVSIAKGNLLKTAHMYAHDNDLCVYIF